MASFQKQAMTEIKPPDSMKKLVACLKCKRVQTQNQFMQEFEGNCPNYKFCGTTNLDDIDVFREKTTSNFSGLVAKLGEGWVSKWQQISKPYVAGVYAIAVKSDLRMVNNCED